jgi:hypothetical protein
MSSTSARARLRCCPFAQGEWVLLRLALHGCTLELWRRLQVDLLADLTYSKLVLVPHFTQCWPNSERSVHRFKANLKTYRLRVERVHCVSPLGYSANPRSLSFILASAF